MITIPNDETTAFLIPPKCQGQMIEVSYAECEDGILMQIFNRSEDNHSIYYTNRDNLIGNFEPWNDEPEFIQDNWIKALML